MLPTIRRMHSLRGLAAEPAAPGSSIFGTVGSTGAVDPDYATVPNPNTPPAISQAPVGPNCPCRYDTRKTQMFLSRQATPNSVPVSVEETGIICEDPGTKQLKIICDETNQSLARNGAALNDCMGASTRYRALSGLTSDTLPFDASVSLSTTSPVQSAPASTSEAMPWKWIAIAAAVGVAGTLAVTKFSK